MMPTSWSATVPHDTQPPPGLQYAIAPAYTPVSVRTGFASQAPPFAPPPMVYGAPPAAMPGPANYSSPPAATPAPETARKKIDWPPSVRSYVQRSFLPGNLDPAVSRPEMEAKLKDIIAKAADDGMLFNLDWDNMPLPQQVIKQERVELLRQQSLSSATASWTPAAQSRSTPPSKKRKSPDGTDDNTSDATPPWRTHNSSGSLEDRISFASPHQTEEAATGKKLSKFQKQLEKRQRRFEGEYKSTFQSSTPEPQPTSGPVVGTCQTLEKRYLRLTSAPNPTLVRPEAILRKTLDLLKTKWRKEGNYSYICDQFKSLRQDLTVQHIKNDFTVSVYEIHARIALEKGDLGEYNQCQTQLRALYQLGLKGNPIEFKAYRILYFIHTANRTALNDALADLTTTEKEERPIKHALNVRSALALGNYHRFFQLYLDTPNMGAYLMDMFVGRERLAAMCNICKAYKQDVRLRFITEELGFESDADAAQFIIDYQGQHLLEERSDYIAFLTAKSNGLFGKPKDDAFRRIDIKGQI